GTITPNPSSAYWPLYRSTISVCKGPAILRRPAPVGAGRHRLQIFAAIFHPVPLCPAYSFRKKCELHNDRLRYRERSRECLGAS
uniref:Uncharacterized protein n=1 Tax=Romanomermis culicivorax TaxID=13658 RepID=A0A915HJ16_ROMCU